MPVESADLPIRCMYGMYQSPFHLSPEKRYFFIAGVFTYCHYYYYYRYYYGIHYTSALHNVNLSRCVVVVVVVVVMD
jgi:hypothetical protein